MKNIRCVGCGKTQFKYTYFILTMLLYNLTF